MEQEEEYITNKLMKRLEQLKKEKQMIANEVRYGDGSNGIYVSCHDKMKYHSDSEMMINFDRRILQIQVEQEEEFLTNTLYKKLEKVHSTWLQRA